MPREDFVPTLSGTPEFPESRASLDKVDLRFRDFAFLGDGAPSALNDMLCNSTFRHSEEEINIFRPWTSSRRLLVDVASGYRSRTGIMPVFSGKLVGPDMHTNRAQFSLNAKLSVSRAILAQRLMRRPNKSAIGRGPFTLLIARQPPTWQGEYPLIDATNVLIGSDLRYDYALSRPASAHLVELVTEIEETIGGPFALAARERRVQGDVGGVYRLSTVEVYWEFDVPSPLSTVDLLSSKLTGAVNRSRLTAKAVVLPASDVAQQSRSVQLDLGRKMWLRVYAKTNRRVRFEVSFGREAITAAHGHRRLASRADLAASIDSLVALASQRLTELFREVSPPLLDATQATTRDLLRAIEASHPDMNIAALVLDGLRSCDRVVPDGNPELLTAVRKLKRQGVLRIVRRQQSWYALSARYQLALANLILPDD